MMYESQEKKTTALLPSVGADGGQPSQNFTNQSIPENACQNNCQIVNSQNNFPTDIVQNGRFCCWRYEERDGRKTKVPYNPLTGKMARSNDVSSFTDFKTAQGVHGYNGIGIGIFNGICAIDIDDCVTDSGYYSGAASEIVSLMHSYTEYSPSGYGLHILFRADGFQYDTKHYYIMNHKVGLEVYVAGATKKYVTLTGNVCESYEFGDRTKELQILLDRFMRRPEIDAVNAINAVNSDLGEEELLNLAKSSKNGDAFTALFSGSQMGYSSQSEADMALCRHLAFWTGKNARKMDALFRKSGLMREKWDRPQSGSTYGAITIQKAIENCGEVYTPKKGQPKDETQPFEPIVPLMPQWSSLPQFPIEALPEVMKNYVTAVAAHSQTSPDMAAVIGLGVLAVCLQGKFKVEGTPGYYEPLSLYTVLIAAPGERKSGVMRAMTSVLYDYEQEFNKSRSDEVRKNRQEREAVERQISGLKKKLENKYDREMEMELQQLEEELADMPELKSIRFFADDCSSEALTSLLANNGGRLAVISAEGGIFDIMAGRYSNKTNIDVWLKGHCGDPIYVDRKSREAECIPHPALSAILTIQPSVLTEIMENTTMTWRGLIARFLYSSPPSRIGSRVFRAAAIPEESKEAYRRLIYRLMDIPVAEETQTLYLSEKAFEVIEAYFAEHEKYLLGEGQATADWANKYIGAVLRIAGLLHCADMDPGHCEISAATIGRAIEIGKYFLAHSGYAYSMMSGDINIRKARFVMAKLEKFGQPEVKRSELFQACRGKFFQKTEEIFPTLELLEEHGYLRQVIPERQGAGRPPDVRILINPAA